MDTIASAVQKELLRALVATYVRTESMNKSTDYYLGHDEATEHMAIELGFTPHELHRAVEDSRKVVPL